MNRQQQGVVAVHAAFVLFLFVGAAWIAVVGGEPDPNDDPIVANWVWAWPIAAMVGVIAAGIAAATRQWVRTGSRSVLFIADMAIPVLALMFAGPDIVDPEYMGELAGPIAAVVLALVCGGFVAAVRPPVTVQRMEPPRPPWG